MVQVIPLGILIGMKTERDIFGPAAPEPRSSVPPDLAPGMCIAGRYELRRKVGSGAMGDVWAARHVSLGEEVAIKIVLRDVFHGDGSSADSRFLLEARVASQLSRKTRHVVSVTDHGEDGPYAYLVMELLAGESLDARLARTGPMPLAKVVPIIHQIARAIEVAHAEGIVHRDLKPSNVFVTVDEEGKAVIKILDFGIAKLRASMRRVPLTTGDAKHTTLRGFLLGTPAYMSPEQARGKTIDHRADVWALVVIAYHLLTGQFPFDGDTPEDLFARLCRFEPTPFSTRRSDSSSLLSDLFSWAFLERIDERFQSAVAFATALEQIEILQKRMGAPQPMGSISLPPPSAHGTATDASETAKPSSPPAPPGPTIESSIVAAGVPRKRRLWPRLVAGGVVLAVLLLTGSILSMYFEREAGRHGELAATAKTIDIAASGKTVLRDEIPPPDPAAATPTVRPVDLPTVGAPVPASHAPQSLTTTASLPVDPPPAAMTSPGAAPIPSPPARSKRIDRSEVF